MAKTVRMSSCSMDRRHSTCASRKNSISLDKPLQMESSNSTVIDKLQHKKRRQKARHKIPSSKSKHAIQKPPAIPEIKRQIINKIDQSVLLGNKMCFVILERIEIKKEIKNDEKSCSEVVKNEKKSCSEVVENEKKSCSKVVENEKKSCSEVVENEKKSCSEVVENEKKSCSEVVDVKVEDALSTSDSKENNGIEMNNKTSEDPKLSTGSGVSLLSKNLDPKIKNYQAVVKIERCKLSQHISTQKSQVNTRRRFSINQGHDNSEQCSNNNFLNERIEGNLYSTSCSRYKRRTRSVEKLNSSNEEVRNERSMSVSEHVMNSNILDNGEVNCGDVDTKKLKNNVESVNNCSVLSKNVSVFNNFHTNNEESKTECPHKDKKIKTSKTFDKSNRLLNNSGNRTTRQTVLNNKTSIDDQSTSSSISSNISSNEPEKQTTLNVIVNKVRRIKKFIQKKFKQDDQKEKCSHNSDCSINLKSKEQVDNTTDDSLKNNSSEEIDNVKCSTISENHYPQVDQDNGDEKQHVTLKIFDPSLNVPALLTNIYSGNEETKNDESAIDNFLSDKIIEESEDNSAVIVENKIVTRRDSAEIIENQKEKNSEIGVSENVVNDNSLAKEDKIDNLSESNKDLAKNDCENSADDSLNNDSIEKIKIVAEEQIVPLVDDIKTTEPKMSPRKRGRPQRLNNVTSKLKINNKTGDNETIKNIENNETEKITESNRTDNFTEGNETQTTTDGGTSENIVKVVKRRGRPPSLHKRKFLNNTLNKSSDSSVVPVKNRGGRPRKKPISSEIESYRKTENENDSSINKSSNTIPIGVDVYKPKRRGRKPKHLLEYESSHLSDSTSAEKTEDTPAPEKVVKKRGRKPWKHLVCKNGDNKIKGIKPNGMIRKRKVKNGFVVKSLQNHLKFVNGVVFPKRRGRKPLWLKEQEARFKAQQELEEASKTQSADEGKSRYFGEAPQLQALPEKSAKKPKKLNNLKLSKCKQIYKSKLVPIIDNVNVVKRKRGRPRKNPVDAEGRPVIKVPQYLQKLAEYRDQALKEQEQERARLKMLKNDGRPTTEGACYENAFLNFLRTMAVEREDDESDDSEYESDATANTSRARRFKTSRYYTDEMINNDVSECVEDLVTTVAGDQAEMARRQDRINKITFPSEIVTSTHVSDIFAETAIILEKMGPETSEITSEMAEQEIVKDRYKLLLGLKKKCEENLTKRQEQDDAYNSGMSDDADSDQNLADRMATMSHEDGSGAVCPLVDDHERSYDEKLTKPAADLKLREHRIVMRISRTSDNMHIIAPSNISVMPMRHDIEADEEEENLTAIDPSQLYPDQLPPANGDMNKFIGNDLSNVQPSKEVKITPKGSDHGYGSSNRVPSESPASSSGGNSSTRLADIDEALKPKKRGRPRKYPIFTESELMAKQMAAAASSTMSSTTIVSQQQATPQHNVQQQQQQQQQQPTLIGPTQIVFTVSPAPNSSEPPPLVPIESSAQLLFNGAPSPAREQPLFEPVESIVVQPKSTKISTTTTEALKAFRKRKREDPTAASSSSTTTTTMTTSTSAPSATTSGNPNVPSILAEFVKTRQNALANEISSSERMNGDLTAPFDQQQQVEKKRRLSEDPEDSNKYGITKELVVQLRKIDETDQSEQADAPQPRPKGKPRILHEEHFKPMHLPLEHNNNHSRKNGQTSNIVLSRALPINPQMLSSENPQAQAMSAAKAPTQPLLMVVPPSQSAQQQQQQQQQVPVPVQAPVQVQAQAQAQTQGLPPPQQFCILFIPDTMYNSETSLNKDAQPTATLVNFQPVPDAEMPTANKQLIFNSPTKPTATIGMNGFIASPTKVAKPAEPAKGAYTCNICSELVEVLNRLESDLSMEEDKTNICCPYCSVTCHPMIRMEHHLTQEHLKCENDQQCQYSLNSRVRMAQHNLSPDRTTYFQASLKCRSCYLIHGSVQELNEHVKQKHKILVRFNNGFNRHLLMQCPADCVCRVGLRNGASPQQRQQMIKRCPNAMRRLEKVESAGYEVYSCTICQNTYMHKMDVIEHLQTSHTVACQFPCPRCLFCFRTRNLLDNHQCCGITIAGKEKLLNVAILPVNVAAAVQEQDKELEQLQAAAAAAAAASSGKNGMRRRNGVNAQVLDAAKRPKIINMIGGKHRKRACPKCKKRIAYRKSLHDHIADHLAHVEKGPRVLALELLKMYIDGLTDLPRLEELRKMLLGHYDNDGMSLVEIVTIEEEELTPEEKIALEREEAREAAAVANIQSGREETVECSKCRASFKRPVSIDPYIRSSLRQLPDPLCEVCDPLPKTRGRKAAALNSSQQQPSPTSADNKSFACGGCSEKFASAADMEAHCRVTFHSSAQTIYVCEQCKRCFSSTEMLEVHQKTHDTMDSSSSEIIAAVESIADHEDHQGGAASVTLNREDSLNDLSKCQDLSDNWESQEEELKLLECFICHELCSSSVVLKNHLKRDHGRRAFICLCCNELIVDVTEIRHMIDSHIKSNFKANLSFEEQAQQRLEAQLLNNVTCEEEVTPKDVEELVQLLGKDRLQSLMVYHDFEGKSCNAVMCCHVCPNFFASRDTCRYHYVWEHDITCLLCDKEFRTQDNGYQHKVTKHTSISSYLWCIQRLCSSIVTGLSLDPSLPSHILAQMVLSKVNFMDVNVPFSEVNLVPTTMDLTSDKSDTVSESLVVLSEDQLPDSGNVIEVTVGIEDSDDELLNMLSLSPNYETCTNDNLGAIENPMIDQIHSTPPQTPVPTAQVPSSPLVDTYLSTGVCKYKPANGTGEESEVLVVTDEDLVKYKNDIDALCSRICNEHATFTWFETREVLTKYFREKEREALAKLAPPIDSTNDITTESSNNLNEIVPSLEDKQQSYSISV